MMMSLFHRVGLLLIVTSLAGCGLVESVSSRFNTRLSADASQDALLVYILLLSEMYPNEAVYVINRVTYTDPGFPSSDTIDQQLPGLMPETVADFKTKAAQTQELSGVFTGTGGRYILVNRDEFYFDRTPANADQCYWMLARCFDLVKFKEAHPGSNGIINLSQVALNISRTQALVTTTIRNDSLSGTEFYVLFAWRNGAWSIQDILETFWTV